jgi:hypothetical protein
MDPELKKRIEDCLAWDQKWDKDCPVGYAFCSSYGYEEIVRDFLVLAGAEVPERVTKAADAAKAKRLGRTK